MPWAHGDLWRRQHRKTQNAKRVENFTRRRRPCWCESVLSTASTPGSEEIDTLDVATLYSRASSCCLLTLYAPHPTAVHQLTLTYLQTGNCVSLARDPTEYAIALLHPYISSHLISLCICTTVTFYVYCFSCIFSFPSCRL